MRHCVWCVLLWGAALAGQPRGDFHFVQFGVGDRVQNAGGTISFQENGEFRLKGKVALGAAAASQLSGGGKYDPAVRVSWLPNPFASGARLKLRVNDAGTILTGSSETGAELFVAVKAGAGQLKGSYAGGYFALNGAKAAGAATAFFEFTADGVGGVTRFRVNGHAAGVDDTNRSEEPTGSSYVARPDGSVAMRFAASDAMEGPLEAFVSADGSAVVGYCAEAGQRGIFVAVRQGGTPRGDYFFDELTGESERFFQPAKTRTGSGSGVARVESDGRVYLVLRALTTLGAMRFGENGMASFAPVPRPGLRNLAVSEDGGFFAGAHVGTPGELTLEHGLFVGLRTTPETLSLTNAAAPGVPTLAIAPGALFALRHSSLNESSRMTLNGSALKAVKAESGEIRFLVPDALKGPEARIEVEGAGAVSVRVEAAAPAIYAACYHADKTAVDAARRAKPGEVVSFHVNGAGKAAGLRIFVSGKPAEIVSRSALADVPGGLEVNVRLPKELRPFVPAPVAVEAGGMFSDLIEIPVGTP